MMWIKLEEIFIQLCQGAVSAWCTEKPCIVDSVPDHMVVVAFQKLAAFIPVVVQKPKSIQANLVIILSSSYSLSNTAREQLSNASIPN